MNIPQSQWIRYRTISKNGYEKCSQTFHAIDELAMRVHSLSLRHVIDCHFEAIQVLNRLL